MFLTAQTQAANAVYRKDGAISLCIIDEQTMREIDVRGIGELVLDFADEFGIEGVIWALSTNGVGFPAYSRQNNQMNL
jgi:hypothetical protein